MPQLRRPQLPPLGRLHVITRGPSLVEHVQQVERAVAGGAPVVQLRVKHHPDGALHEAVQRAVAACAGSATVLLVNDRVALASVFGAHGVHVGAEDARPASVRDVIRRPFWVGATAGSRDEAVAREAEGSSDYLGVGPVYGTRSKADAKPTLGLPAFQAICASTALPVVAIGSLTPERVDEVVSAGAWGVAAIGAIWDAPSPQRAIEAFLRALDEVRP